MIAPDKNPAARVTHQYVPDDILADPTLSQRTFYEKYARLVVPRGKLAEDHVLIIPSGMGAATGHQLIKRTSYDCIEDAFRTAHQIVKQRAQDKKLTQILFEDAQYKRSSSRYGVLHPAALHMVWTSAPDAFREAFTKQREQNQGWHALNSWHDLADDMFDMEEYQYIQIGSGRGWYRFVDRYRPAQEMRKVVHNCLCEAEGNLPPYEMWRVADEQQDAVAEAEELRNIVKRQDGQAEIMRLRARIAEIQASMLQ